MNQNLIIKSLLDLENKIISISNKQCVLENNIRAVIDKYNYIDNNEVLIKDDDINKDDDIDGDNESNKNIGSDNNIFEVILTNDNNINDLHQKIQSLFPENDINVDGNFIKTDIDLSKYNTFCLFNSGNNLGINTTSGYLRSSLYSDFIKIGAMPYTATVKKDMIHNITMISSSFSDDDFYFDVDFAGVFRIKYAPESLYILYFIPK